MRKDRKIQQRIGNLKKLNILKLNSKLERAEDSINCY